MSSICILHDISEVRSVGDAQASQAVRVPSLSEVLLEGFGALGRKVAADQVETMQKYSQYGMGLPSQPRGKFLGL